jgi:hypothetical protein
VTVVTLMYGMAQVVKEKATASGWHVRLTRNRGIRISVGCVYHFY